MDERHDGTGNGRNGSRQRKARDTYEKLLEAGRQVFCANGWYGATIDDIVKLAGVSRGSFYVYFNNKHDIFERLIVPVLDSLYAKVGARLPGTTIFGRLEEGNRAYLETWSAEPDLLRIMFEVNLDVNTGHSVSEMRRKFIARSANAIRRHQSEGIVNDGIDPDFAAGALAGMVTDYARERWYSSRTPRAVDILRTSYQLSALWYRAVYSSAAPPVPPEAEYRAMVLGSVASPAG